MILCKFKDRTIVEYALRESKKPIDVASYRIVWALPADLQGQLLTPEQIDSLREEIPEVAASK